MLWIGAAVQHEHWVLVQRALEEQVCVNAHEVIAALQRGLTPQEVHEAVVHQKIISWPASHCVGRPPGAKVWAGAPTLALQRIGVVIVVPIEHAATVAKVGFVHIRWVANIHAVELDKGYAAPHALRCRVAKGVKQQNTVAMVAHVVLKHALHRAHCIALEATTVLLALVRRHIVDEAAAQRAAIADTAATAIAAATGAAPGLAVGYGHPRLRLAPSMTDLRRAIVHDSHGFGRGVVEHLVILRR